VMGHAHVVRDLGSRYTLRVLGDDAKANGWQVARNLEEMIDQHGAPLFLKMDGGSNLGSGEVLSVLEAQWVIPLVSPPHYPPYNGGIERANQEILGHLSARIGACKVSARELRLECELSGHEVNHKPRRSLNGWTSCQALTENRTGVRQYGRRERKEAYEQIKVLAVDIAARLDEHVHTVAETAFRHAAETWMQRNNVIRVTRNGKVLPPFYRFRSH